MARRRANAGAPRAQDARELGTWRGVMLVGVGGAGLAALGLVGSARAGAWTFVALWGAAHVALLALAAYAVRRVRRALAP